MPVETKKLFRIYAILGAVVIVLSAALVVLIMYFTTVNKPHEPQMSTQSVPEITLPTEPTLPQSRFTAEDFAYEGDYLTCLSAGTMLGIDVSHHQQEIDWAQVKEAGIQFVMVRLGYRGLAQEGTLYTDRFALQNLQGAREAGLLVGAYFYSQATSWKEAEEEAYYALEILGNFQLDLPLVFDWEQEKRNAQVDVDTATACCVAFCRVIQRAGIDPMIYFNSYQATELVDLNRLRMYPWWLAMYDTQGEFPCRFDMWQYTCTGTVPGIEGNVDVNLMILGA